MAQASCLWGRVLAPREHFSRASAFPNEHLAAAPVIPSLPRNPSSLAPEELGRKINTPIGELNLAQTIDTFVIWHVNAHCGEIAALKGCQGAKGYPF